jgi:hypothetical protein
MRSRIKKSLELLLIIAMPTVALLIHWHYLFPRSARSDFRFQAIGESLEVLVILGTFALLYFGFTKERRKVSPVPVSDGKRALAGVAFVVMLIALGWRTFFPGDQFSLSAGIGDLIGALITGVFMSFSMRFPKPAVKPAKEEERSVV